MSLFFQSTYSRKFVLFGSILFWGLFVQAMTSHWLETPVASLSHYEPIEEPVPAEEIIPVNIYTELPNARSVVFVQVTEIRTNGATSDFSVLIQNE